MRLQNFFKRKHEWLSRKLWFSIFAIVMLYVGLRESIDSAFFAAAYGTFAGSVVAVCGLFLTGNVIAQKFGGGASPTKLETHATPEETPS